MEVLIYNCDLICLALANQRLHNLSYYMACNVWIWDMDDRDILD